MYSQHTQAKWLPFYMERKRERKKIKVLWVEMCEFVSLHLMRFDLFTPEIGQYFIRTACRAISKRFFFQFRSIYSSHSASFYCRIDGSYRNVCRSHYARAWLHSFLSFSELFDLILQKDNPKDFTYFDILNRILQSNYFHIIITKVKSFF